jgi:hypothetical protein
VKPSLDADHIIEMYSIKLIEQTRKEMVHVSQAVRIELSSVQLTGRYDEVITYATSRFPKPLKAAVVSS